MKPKIFDNAHGATAGWKTDFSVIGAFALLKMTLNGAFLTQYGFQQDELYFIACGRRLSFGYVDHGPMVPWIARLSQALFGESLAALRVFPLLAGGLSVILAGLLVREMKGGRWAQALACAAMVASPVYLRTHSILHIPTFEMIYWIACFLILARIINTGNEKLWLLFGFIAGVGILNKPTMLFFGTGVAAALILTPLRKHLLRPWIYVGGSIALLLFLPNLVWQHQHDWATYRFVKQLNQDQMQTISFVEFMLGQLLYMGPLNALIWLPGLWFLVFSKRGRTYRALGFICMTVFAILVIAKAKAYYLAPAYPALYAGGALALERLTERRFWVRCAAFALPAIGLAWLAPLGLPMLPIDAAPGVLRTITGGILSEDDARSVTDDWRDQYGWENQVATIARVYDSLAPDEKAQCSIIAWNIGQASAIDFFGKQYGLPPAVCPQLNYYLWGPGTRPGNVAIVYGIPAQRAEAFFDGMEKIEGISRDRLTHFFAQVTYAATVNSEHATEWETNLPVFVCKTPEMSLQDAWKHIKPIGF